MSNYLSPLCHQIIVTKITDTSAFQLIISVFNGRGEVKTVDPIIIIIDEWMIFDHVSID